MVPPLLLLLLALTPLLLLTLTPLLLLLLTLTPLLLLTLTPLLLLTLTPLLLLACTPLLLDALTPLLALPTPLLLDALTPLLVLPTPLLLLALTPLLLLALTPLLLELALLTTLDPDDEPLASGSAAPNRPSVAAPHAVSAMPSDTTKNALTCLIEEISCQARTIWSSVTPTKPCQPLRKNSRQAGYFRHDPERWNVQGIPRIVYRKSCTMIRFVPGTRVQQGPGEVGRRRSGLGASGGPPRTRVSAHLLLTSLVRTLSRPRSRQPAIQRLEAQHGTSSSHRLRLARHNRHRPGNPPRSCIRAGHPWSRFRHPSLSRTTASRQRRERNTPPPSNNSTACTDPEGTCRWPRRYRRLSIRCPTGKVALCPLGTRHRTTSCRPLRPIRPPIHHRGASCSIRHRCCSSPRSSTTASWSFPSDIRPETRRTSTSPRPDRRPGPLPESFGRCST
jgi:hypothetical protein